MSLYNVCIPKEHVNVLAARQRGVACYTGEDLQIYSMARVNLEFRLIWKIFLGLCTGEDLQIYSMARVNLEFRLIWKIFLGLF